MTDTDPRWGNQILGPLPSAADVVVDVLINSDLGPQPSAHGVMLFCEPLGNASGNAAYYADISFGGGAASTNFLCDWRGQFSLVCSHIEIRARSYQPRNIDYSQGSSAERYRHGALLGFGGWHAARPLTFTGSELLIDPLDDVSWINVIAVPKFGRRFFPRFGRTTGANGTPATPSYRADVEAISIGITQPGNPQADFSQAEQLSVSLVRDGIDVSNADYVTITAPMLPTKYYLTPVFELAL